MQPRSQRPFTSSRGWLYKTRGTCLVEIETDDGIVGWGECYGPSAVAKAFIDTQLAPRVIGRDPFDVEVIWEDLYNRIKDYGPKGMSIAAHQRHRHRAVGHRRQGLQQADPQADRRRVPHRSRLPMPPASTSPTWTGWSTKPSRKLAATSEEGFKAIKMKIGLGSIKRDFDRVKAVREAIGPDVKLMVDANHCLTVPAAIRLGRKLEELDIEWFEEPISPEDIDGYVEVSRALDMAVAGGENEFTRWGFRDAIVRKAMDIVQPDVCAAGGITECKKIATLASTHGVECVPHAWGSAVGLAATIHFLASIPNQPPSLFPMPPMLEFEQEENPFRDHLARRADPPGQGQDCGPDRRRPRHRDRSRRDRPLPRRVNRSPIMKFVSFSDAGFCPRRRAARGRRRRRPGRRSRASVDARGAAGHARRRCWP